MKKIALTLLLLCVSAMAQVNGTVQETCGVPVSSVANGSVATNFKFASRFTCPAMTVTAGHLYLPSGLVSGGKIKMVVYSVSAGEPTSLVGISDELLGPISSGTFANFVFSTPISLSAGDYYIGYIYSAGTTMNVGITNSVGVARYNSDTYSDGASSPFGTPTSASIRLHAYLDGYAASVPASSFCGTTFFEVNTFATGIADHKYAGLHDCPFFLVSTAHSYQVATAGVKIKAVVYGSSSGPTNLLATSNEVTTSDSGEEGHWLHFTFTPFTLTPGSYFLGFIVSGGIKEGGVTAGTTASCSGVDTYSDGPSDPFGACTGASGRSSYYLQGTPLGGPPIIYIGQ